VLRFDDVLSDALELGALKNNEIKLSPEQLQTLFRHHAKWCAGNGASNTLPILSGKQAGGF